MNHLLLRRRVALGLIPLLAISGWALAWDLTCPLSDAFPPPIGVSPGVQIKGGTPDAVDPSFEDQLIELVNQERWTNGQLPPLKRVVELDISSEVHSANMASRNFAMHCDPDTGTWPWDRMVAAGYIWSSAAENIAWGYPDPAAVIAGWMASSGHRANILSTSLRELGNGYFYESGDTGNVRRTSTSSCTPNIFNEGPFFRYWTQNFGKRNSVYPVVINREALVTESRDVALFLYGSWNEMRLRNESGAWTAWLPFAANTSWQLSPGNGTKTVAAEMRSGSTVVTSTDTIILEDTGEILFIDGFESGGTSEWSAVSP